MYRLPFSPTHRALRRSFAALVAATALLAAGCGSGDDDDLGDVTDTTEAPDATDPPTTEPAPTSTTPDTTGPVNSLEDVQAATIQIVAQGSFVDPEFGAYEGAGAGSGFVIDKSGIAVTNNHVVVGAGLLQVFVQGEDRPRNAKVLGVSECSDLAVIDIDGDDLPTLAWYDGALSPGLDVFAAGYPLGDPEFTLTRGIISKTEANGDVAWASIDHALEHDASIQPGNSGGPLVTEDGLVAGINFAGSNPTNTSQYFAIAFDDAQGIVEQLRDGIDVNSLGINGQAVVDEEAGIAGVWVSGVASGSPADKTGIEPGDIVTRIEGVSVGTDGTLKDYCDVLRSHDATDPLAVEVLRYATEEVLNGQFNGEVLTTSFSFADSYDDEVADGAEYDEYVSVSDDSGSIFVSVPTAWADVRGEAIDIAGVSSPAISASPDVDAFNSGWDVPGMQFIASSALLGYTPDELLDALSLADCTSDGREDYDDGTFVGRFEVFSSCAGTATSYYLVAANDPNGLYGVAVGVQVVSDADLDALDSILRTFNVNS